MFSVIINKNCFVKLSVAFAAVTLLSGCGTARDDGKVSAAVASQGSAGEQSAAAESLEVHYEYLAQEELRVKPITLGILSADELVIPAGTPIKVLSTKLDETYGTVVHLGIKGDASLPADAWFVLDESLLGALQTKEAVPATVASAQ